MKPSERNILLPPYDLDFNDEKLLSAWSGVEAANPREQVTIVPVEDHSMLKWAARIKQRPTDTWKGNNTIRCLLNRLDTDETVGETRSYFMAFKLLTPLSNNLLWELHQPRSIYTLPNAGVAPHALLCHNGGLIWRTATGNLGTAGWPYWKPSQSIAGFASVQLNRWIEIAVEISFSVALGTVLVYVRYAGDPWPSNPQINLLAIPTTQYSTKDLVPPVKLYTEAGLYRGTNVLNSTEEILFGGVFARSNIQEALLIPDKSIQLPAPDPEIVSIKARLDSLELSLDRIENIFVEINKVTGT
jgi:hypothetical protein